VHIPAKVEYGIRALLSLVPGDPRTAESLASEQDLPVRFLASIMADLRRGGLVANRRGAVGGYRLARLATQISLADALRVLDGPLAEVRGLRPEATSYEGAAVHLKEVWVAVRASLRMVLDTITLADVASGEFPEDIKALTADPDAWKPR
jgi:Rrf2 family protein